MRGSSLGLQESFCEWLLEQFPGCGEGRPGPACCASHAPLFAPAALHLQHTLLFTRVPAALPSTDCLQRGGAAGGRLPEKPGVQHGGGTAAAAHAERALLCTGGGVRGLGGWPHSSKGARADMCCMHVFVKGRENMHKLAVQSTTPHPSTPRLAPSPPQAANKGPRTHALPSFPPPARCADWQGHQPQEPEGQRAEAAGGWLGPGGHPPGQVIQPAAAGQAVVCGSGETGERGRGQFHARSWGAGASRTVECCRVGWVGSGGGGRVG